MKPFRKLRAVENCPQPEPPPFRPIQYGEYIPQPEDARIARGVMQNIADATPRGIRREQFVRRHHPVKTALAVLPFVAFAVLAAFAIITR